MLHSFFKFFLLLGVLLRRANLFKMGVFFFCGGIWAADHRSILLLLGALTLVVRRSIAVSILLFLLAFLGFFRYEMALPEVDFRFLSYYNDRETPLLLKGWIADMPDVRSDRLRLTVEVDSILEVESTLEEHFVDGKVLVTLPRYPDDYAYGMTLRFEGILRAPMEFEDFSYRNYLRRYGIGSVMYEPSFIHVEGTRHPNPWELLYLFKGRLEHRINRLFPEPEASFSAGLLLGSRRSIPPSLLEAFNATGLTHLLAISGYNITLLITFIAGMLRFLPQRLQIVFSTGVVGLFVVLVGASAAVVRAAFMGILSLWAIWFRRPSEASHLLFLSAGVMSMANPFLITDDIGFQLSFAATAGLIYCTEWLQNVFKKIGVYGKIPTFFAIRDSLITTLAAQVFTTPLILVYFGRFSLIAPLANVCVAPLVPLAMLFSSAALIGSLFWWQAGLNIAYFASFFLDWILTVAEWGARFGWASLDLPIS